MIPLEGLKEYMRKEQDVFAHARFLVFEKLIQNIVQIGASLLDACVLAVLDRWDVYGYELTVKIKSIIEISESTLYPVLLRLQKDGYRGTDFLQCVGTGGGRLYADVDC